MSRSLHGKYLSECHRESWVGEWYRFSFPLFFTVRAVSLPTLGKEWFLRRRQFYEAICFCCVSNDHDVVGVCILMAGCRGVATSGGFFLMLKEPWSKIEGVELVMQQGNERRDCVKCCFCTWLLQLQPPPPAQLSPSSPFVELSRRCTRNEQQSEWSGLFPIHALLHLAHVISSLWLLNQVRGRRVWKKHRSD